MALAATCKTWSVYLNVPGRAGPRSDIYLPLKTGHPASPHPAPPRPQALPSLAGPRRPARLRGQCRVDGLMSATHACGTVPGREQHAVCTPGRVGVGYGELGWGGVGCGELGWGGAPPCGEGAIPDANKYTRRSLFETKYHSFTRIPRMFV